MVQSQFIRPLCVLDDKRILTIPSHLKNLERKPCDSKFNPNFFEEFWKTEKGKEENIWNRKICFFVEEIKNGEENIFIAVKKKNREGKGGKYLEKSALLRPF